MSDRSSRTDTNALARILEYHRFDTWGVAGISVDQKARERFQRWIADGRHGTMEYLARSASARFDPRQIVAKARTIIVVAVNYFQKRPQPSAGRGIVSRYAWGRDYHNEIGGRLRRVVRDLSQAFPGDSFRPFVDATPIGEASAATQAGLGFQGRNTLLITPRFGSWVFLGEILSTRSFETSGSRAGENGCPSRCRRCVEMCPTGAIELPGVLDARKCISYLTIEYSGFIEPAMMEAIGTRIFGCDACQEACPLNRVATETTVESFCAHRVGPDVEIGEILRLGDERAFADRFAGTPLMRAKRTRLIRNALIVAGNGAMNELSSLVEEHSHATDPVIAQTAAWAAKKLAGTG